MNGPYAYSANRLTQQSGGISQSYQYDGAGRMVSDGYFSYTYDALGRLSVVSGRTGTTATYRYNALGQRIAKDSYMAGNIRFVHDESGHLLGEYDAQGKPIQELVWLDELPVASLRPKSSGVGTDGVVVFAAHVHMFQMKSAIHLSWLWSMVFCSRYV